MRLRAAAPALILLALGACREGTGPDAGAFRIEAVSGDDQIGAVGASLEEPFVVRVTDGGKPAKDIAVSWEVVDGGADARMTPASSKTDEDGIALARLRLGQQAGHYEVHARVAGSSAAPAAFTARAVLEPVVSAVQPGRAAVGDVVAITGDRFSENPAEVAVLFDGVRGTVVRATPTRVEAVVPACIPTRTVDVTVRIGPVESRTSAPLDVTGDDAAPIDLAPGDVLSISDPAAMECVRLPAEPGARFLVVQQNAADRLEQTLPFQLLALAAGGQGIVASLAPGARDGAATFAQARTDGPGAAQAAWETRLRSGERALLRAGPPTAAPPRTASVPSVGDRRSFQVYNKDDKFTTVTAEVKHVSARAVLYQDVNAPAGGFTDEDFASFAAVFDDPIFTIEASVFGQPPDIDGNGRIVILFTPVVNELTPAGAGSSVVAGFFYGIDLYPKTTYANSNEAEIFYSIVPDPSGRHGNVRSRDFVLRVVPPVLAHELQHMIHFEERRKVGASQDVLWLSEGLAHMAEELVAAEFERRGDHDRATLFRRENHDRAYRYLQAMDRHTILEEKNPGTLESRGGAWLFLQYLAGHFGGDAVLRALTRSARDGVENVEAATGTTWAELFARWSVALWADDAPELAGVPVDPAYTFPDFDLRRALSGGRSFPLRPGVHGFADLSIDGSLPASSASYVILEAGDPLIGTGPSLHLRYGRPRGDAFRPTDRPRWTILRIR